MIKSIVSKLTGCSCGHKTYSKNVKSSSTSNNKEAGSKVVCGCYNVTDQDLKNAINKGAKSYKEVQEITKVGTGCGKCSPGNEVLVNKMILKKKIDENQVVCGCFNVKVQDMIQAIKNGASSFEDVQAVTKAGTGCGGCVAGNKALVAELLTMYK